jgi:hypothetical protein
MINCTVVYAVCAYLGFVGEKYNLMAWNEQLEDSKEVVFWGFS